MGFYFKKMVFEAPKCYFGVGKNLFGTFDTFGKPGKSYPGS